MTTKNQVTADKAFPWRCGECGEKKVSRSSVQHKSEVKHDGRKHELVIPNLQVPKCENCGEVVFDNFAGDQISIALRELLGLLTPEAIRKNRKGLGLGQKELARDLGVATESISRWENDCMIQSQSNDRLLRLYFESQLVRDRLKAMSTRQPADATLDTRGGEAFVRKKLNKETGKFASLGENSENPLSHDEGSALIELAVLLDKLPPQNALLFVKNLSRALFQS